MPTKRRTDLHIFFGGQGNQRPVKRIKLDKDYLKLYVGDTYDFEYSVIPSNAMYTEITWESNNENVVSVDENGHIVALARGRAIVRISIDERHADCKIEVEDYIRFEDPVVERIMLRNYDYDCDGKISYYEAKFVTSIPFPMFTSMPITSFNEMAYFPNLTTIAPHAFDSCTQLTYISLPPTITKIGKNAFTYCNSLTEITIPPHVETIGTEAFSYCDNLTTAYINSNNPPKNGNEIFHWCPSLDRIIVPGDYLDRYLEAINWGMLNDEEYLYYSYIVIQCFDYTFDFFLS